MAVKKKIVLLGDSSVGKTSLIRKYVFDQFEDSYISTIGSKVTRKDLQIENSNGSVDMSLMIWDLIGREGYVGFHAKTFTGVNGALLVTDLTRRETLESLERYWIPALFNVVENVPLVFAANKSDLGSESEFEIDDLNDIGSKYNGRLNDDLSTGLPPVFQTSARSGDHVINAFESLGYMMLSEAEPSDPVKELFESLVATGVRRTSDQTTLIGALDEIILDFSEGFDDSRLGMAILRQEFPRAGLDISKPTKSGIVKAIEYLAEAEQEFQDQETVQRNKDKRMKLIANVKE